MCITDAVGNFKIKILKITVKGDQSDRKSSKFGEICSDLVKPRWKGSSLNKRYGFSVSRFDLGLDQWLNGFYYFRLQLETFSHTFGSFDLQESGETGVRSMQVYEEALPYFSLIWALGLKQFGQLGVIRLGRSRTFVRNEHSMELLLSVHHSYRMISHIRKISG